ncbi:hypothetical protein AC1031_017558 [Aphanomyces cochlioides]|nr:hypothetical protein AC1031_017558 [Aphanomyces cochlioides]
MWIDQTNLELSLQSHLRCQTSPRTHSPQTEMEIQISPPRQDLKALDTCLSGSLLQSLNHPLLEPPSPTAIKSPTPPRQVSPAQSPSKSFKWDATPVSGSTHFARSTSPPKAEVPSQRSPKLLARTIVAPSIAGSSPTALDTATPRAPLSPAKSPGAGSPTQGLLQRQSSERIPPRRMFKLPTTEQDPSCTALQASSPPRSNASPTSPS